MYEALIAHLRECAKLDPSNNTYAEAADAIEELTGFVQEAERDRDEYRERLDKANDAIEELQADKAALNGTVTNLLDQIKDLGKPRWIPVTERKPKTDDLVIVAIHDDSGDTPYDVTNVGFYLDVFPLGIWVVENERCNYVTHWMPLPEPPNCGAKKGGRVNDCLL